MVRGTRGGATGGGVFGVLTPSPSDGVDVVAVEVEPQVPSVRADGNEVSVNHFLRGGEPVVETLDVDVCVRTYGRRVRGRVGSGGVSGTPVESGDSVPVDTKTTYGCRRDSRACRGLRRPPSKIVNGL